MELLVALITSLASIAASYAISDVSNTIENARVSANKRDSDSVVKSVGKALNEARSKNTALYNELANKIYGYSGPMSNALKAYISDSTQRQKTRDRSVMNELIANSANLDNVETRMNNYNFLSDDAKNSKSGKDTLSQIKKEAKEVKEKTDKIIDDSSLNNQTSDIKGDFNNYEKRI